MQETYRYFYAELSLCIDAAVRRRLFVVLPEVFMPRRCRALCLAAVAALLPGAALAAPPIAEPGYADVLARPDDAPLNLAYALRLVREGHLNAAAATLERVLLTHPEADDVRVTYMIVLYRLDDLAGARREAEILSTRALAGQLAADYARYAERIAALAKPTRFSAYLGSGLRVDSNARPITDADGLKPRDGDLASVTMAGLAVEHRPASGAIERLFASIDLGSRLNAEHSEFDLFTGTAEAGLESRFGGLVLRLSGFANVAFVDRELFARDAGGRARLSYEIDGHWQVFGDIEVADSRFHDIPIAAHEIEHDGGRWRAGGGLAWRLNDRHQIVVAAHWTDKHARDAAYAYDGGDVEAKWLGTFAAGQYLSLGLRYAAANYDGYDVEYGAVRADDTVRARLSYGLPVRTLGDWIGFDTSGAFFSFGDLVLQTSLDYVDQRSNIADFDYRNLGAEVMLTRRFQF
jgi:hypothetical protein